MPKPTQFPIWATSGTVTDPGAPKKDQGWTFEEEPPFDFFNWLHFTANAWIEFLYTDMLSPIINDVGALKTNAVTTLSIAPNAVTTAKIGNAQVTAAKIPDGEISNVKIRDAVGTSILGRATNSAGDVDDINASANDRVLARSSDTLSFQAISEAMIANNAVGNAKLVNMNATTVKGNPSAISADPSDIAASGDGQVLRQASGSLAFGEIATAGIGDDQVTLAKIAGGAAHLVYGTDVSGDPELTQIQEAQIADNQVTLAKLAGGTANRVFGTDGSGDPELALIDEDQVSGAVARWAAGGFVAMGAGSITDVTTVDLPGRGGNAVKGAATASAFGFAYVSTGITDITCPTGTDVEDYVFNISQAFTGVAYMLGIVRQSSTVVRVTTRDDAGAVDDISYNFQALRVT